MTNEFFKNVLKAPSDTIA